MFEVLFAAADPIKQIAYLICWGVIGFCVYGMLSGFYYLPSSIRNASKSKRDPDGMPPWDGDCDGGGY
jgi:hypothetical protein